MEQTMTEKIRCEEHNELVPVKDAFIVSLGENGHDFVIGPGAMKMVTGEKRLGVPCDPGEEGLEFYELTIYQGSVGRGKLLFSVGKHDGIYLPFIEPILISRYAKKV